MLVVLTSNSQEPTINSGASPWYTSLKSAILWPGIQSPSMKGWYISSVTGRTISRIGKACTLPTGSKAPSCGDASLALCRYRSNNCC